MKKITKVLLNIFAYGERKPSFWPPFMEKMPVYITDSQTPICMEKITPRYQHALTVNAASKSSAYSGGYLQNPA